MPSGPIRRAQLIAPFGVGSMVVVRDGTSLISGGLDHWYERESRETNSASLDLAEFIVEEWRLQRRLGVDSLRLPPDYRRGDKKTPNFDLTIPFLRFPQVHFCPWCRRLEKIPLTRRAFVLCQECQLKGKKNYLMQVPFVAMCDHGHIQDFPWREWVHKTAVPECSQPIRLRAVGGTTLASQVIECDCGVHRNLSQIMNADEKSSYLSNNLDDSGTIFKCQGKRPWLGTEEGVLCDRPLRGTLRSASNVHFAVIKSSIYLPRSSDDAPEELVKLMEEAPLSALVHLLTGTGIGIKPEHLRGQHRLLLQPFSDDQISAALKIVTSQEADTASVLNLEEDPETAYRRAEYETLKKPRNGDQLLIKRVNLAGYDKEIIKYFSEIMLIDKLRETRAFAGFTRVLPENDLTPGQLKNLLRAQSSESRDNWLPAYVVYGEGIFLVLNESKVTAWEKKKEVIERINKLNKQYQSVRKAKGLSEEHTVPRFLLLHTLAHTLINRLTFECGYSSASLRERLYCSNNPKAPMAGILIYTAAGDAEGTMGGLVRMGKPGYFEPVVRRALEGATWCSADPVCMEMGSSGGQGPDSCNLAACHNCSLVPETACENFNRFLDRALLVGDFTNNDLGYFI